VKTFKHLLLSLGLLAVLGSQVSASATRAWDADTIKSSDHTKTWTMPSTTDTLAGQSTANGGTGQTSYTDGQILIGNSSGNGLTKSTLTAGTGITVTNGNGSITIAASGGSALGQNEIYLTGQAGYGSAGSNKVIHYTNVVTNTGSSMTLTQDAVNGDYITINTTGGYAITVNAEFSVAAQTATVGISKNASSLTTNVGALANAQRVVPLVHNPANGSAFAESGISYLTSGDVIRVQTNGATLSGTNDAEEGVRILRVF
jgi:hypothetical protein